MKNFPQNTRALRMVDEELLQPIISRAESQEDMVSIWRRKQQRAGLQRTG